jgi:glycerate 2-kinase
VSLSADQSLTSAAQSALAGPATTPARGAVASVAAAGLLACDPGRAVDRLVRVGADAIEIAGVSYPLAPGASVVVLGGGKASLPIALALEAKLGDRLRGGAIALRSGVEHSLQHLEVLIADHPLPSDASVSAAQRLLQLAAETHPDDLVLACFTGGSSALVSLPPEGVTAEEKRELHRLLLAGGVPIVDVNAVRKHVSAVKGGRLALAVPSRRVVNLTVSDVVGDLLDAITDPTVVDTTTAADAVRVLQDNELWERVAPSIRRHLSSGNADSPALDGIDIRTILLAAGITACEAMAAASIELGYTPVILSTAHEGEAREFGRILGTFARESGEHGRPFGPGTMLIGCGGEATVTLEQGSFGDGGPNQEVGLAFALATAGAPGVAGLFLDSDGSDGGTDIAGALVDGETAKRAVTLGLDLATELRAHRASAPLLALGDAVRTGPTGTNVNDLFAVAIGTGSGAA